MEQSRERDLHVLLAHETLGITAIDVFHGAALSTLADALHASVVLLPIQ